MIVSMTNLGYLVFTALALVGFASGAASRVRLALESHRSGDRLEMVRSTILAMLMSLFAVGAAYGTVIRIVRIALTPH
jgi:hypothetical protein